MNVFVNKGDGTFASPVAYAYQTSGHTAALSDLDGDGHLDAVVTDSNRTVTVAFNDGAGGFADHTIITLDSDVWPDDVALATLMATV